jgi:D-alanyl-D-alanine carboxypeptidase (penicillin-binding protein 5/6)
LLTYGFKNFQYIKVKSDGDIVGNMEVENGKTKSLPVKIKNDISVVLPSMSIDDVKNIEYAVLKNTDSVNAPIAEDVLVGKLEVRFNGETLATSDVYTAQSVSKEGFLKRLLNMIGSFFGRIF